MVGEQKTPLLRNGVLVQRLRRGLLSLTRESTSYAGVTRIRF